MVFRRGDVLRKNEQWFYKGEKNEVVSRYKYLGIFFSTKLKGSTSVNKSTSNCALLG